MPGGSERTSSSLHQILVIILQGLFLQFNNIELLPPQLFSISALSVLVLDSNCLTRMPDDVGQLQQLTVTIHDD
jgi:hypothetical protein